MAALQSLRTGMRTLPAHVGSRTFSTSRPAADLAKMSLIGNLVGDIKTRRTKNDKEYLIYTVRTRDPVFRSADSAEPSQSSSYHSIFAYGPATERLKTLKIGSLVHVEATFTVENVKSDSGDLSQRLYASHERLHVIMKPKIQPSESEEGEHSHEERERSSSSQGYTPTLSS